MTEHSPSTGRHQRPRSSTRTQVADQGHGHGPTAPSSPTVRRLLVFLLVPCALAALAGMVLLYPFGVDQKTGAALGLHQQPIGAQITASLSSPCASGVADSRPGPTPNTPKQCLTLTVRLEEGPAAGRTIQQIVPVEPSTPRFAVGDRVVLSYAGSAPAEGGSYQIVDFQRGFPLAVLAVLFALAVLVLGRWQGLAALTALVLSFVVLLLFVLPAILAGENPLTVAVVGACVIMFVVLYLTHGLSARTSTAVLGTLVSLGLIAGLGALFSLATKLTGLDEETANLISLLGHGIDSRGLLLAATVIGALGVLDDVTVTQTSSVWELRRANPALTWRELYKAGMRIGRDHVSSAVNTLVMAYAGAALPVLLAYSVAGRTFGEVLTTQAIAQEVVRTCVGSIGLVAAVPITTMLAALVASQEKPDFLGTPAAVPIPARESGQAPTQPEPAQPHQIRRLPPPSEQIERPAQHGGRPGTWPANRGGYRPAGEPDQVARRRPQPPQRPAPSAASDTGRHPHWPPTPPSPTTPSPSPPRPDSVPP